MLSRNDVKTLAKLRQKKFRLAEQKILIEGPRLVMEALKSDWRVEEILYTPDFRRRPLASRLIQMAEENATALYEVPESEFRRLSETVHTQGVLAVVQVKRWEAGPAEILQRQHKCMLVAIEKLQDPGNLGTIIRTAEWLGAAAIVLGPECVEWSNPKTLRATMGAVFYLPVFELDDFFEFLEDARRSGAVLYAAHQEGDFPYSTLRYVPKKVLLLGEEASGLSPQCAQFADYTIAIPRRGRIESLNVSIAAAILMAEMTRS